MLELIDAELKRNPEYAEFIWLKGFALYKQGKTEEALGFLKEADELIFFDSQLKEDIREVERALHL